MTSKKLIYPKSHLRGVDYEIPLLTCSNHPGRWPRSPQPSRRRFSLRKGGRFFFHQSQTCPESGPRSELLDHCAIWLC